MNNPRTYILTACHNEKKNVLSLLADLFKQSYPNIKVVVVDDGSSDQTAKEIRLKHPKTKVINGSGNLWWTGSIALGIDHVLTEATPTDFVIIINSDCRVKPSFVTNLVSKSHERPSSLIGSVIIDQKSKSIIDSAIKVRWHNLKFLASKKYTKNKIIESDVLTTKGVIYPVQVFHDIGNFDDKHFPHYLSDYDFSLRAKKAGYNLYITTDSVVYNDKLRTGIGENLDQVKSPSRKWELMFSKRSRLNIKDHFLFILRHSPKKYLLTNLTILFLKYAYLWFRV